MGSLLPSNSEAFGGLNSRALRPGYSREEKSYGERRGGLKWAERART